MLGASAYREAILTCCILVILSQVSCTASPVATTETDTCTLCPANWFCSNGSAARCPPGTESAEGSSASSDCSCKNLWFATPQGGCIRVHTTQQNTTVPNASTMAVLSFVVTLNMTFTDFNRVVQDEYVTLVATAFSTTYSSVSILLITEPILRRTAVHTASTNVQTNVTIPINMIGTTIIDTTLSTLNMLLTVSDIMNLKTNTVDMSIVLSNTTTALPSNSTTTFTKVMYRVNSTTTPDTLTDNTPPIFVIVIGVLVPVAVVCIYPVWIYKTGARKRNESFSSTVRRVFAVGGATVRVHNTTSNILEPEEPLQVSVDVFNVETERVYNTVETDEDVSTQISCDLFNDNHQDTYAPPSNHMDVFLNPTRFPGELHGVKHTRHKSHTNQYLQRTIDVPNTLTYSRYDTTAMNTSDSVSVPPQISSDLFNRNLQVTYSHPVDTLMDTAPLTKKQHTPKGFSSCTITRHATQK
jgi:hypothetical protein